jgi:hypothetical protein
MSFKVILLKANDGIILSGTCLRQRHNKVYSTQKGPKKANKEATNKIALNPEEKIVAEPEAPAVLLDLDDELEVVVVPRTVVLPVPAGGAVLTPRPPVVVGVAPTVALEGLIIAQRFWKSVKATSAWPQLSLAAHIVVAFRRPPFVHKQGTLRRVPILLRRVAFLNMSDTLTIGPQLW